MKDEENNHETDLNGGGGCSQCDAAGAVVDVSSLLSLYLKQSPTDARGGVNLS